MIPVPADEEQRRLLRCGLVPLSSGGSAGKATIATTSGLKWNLKEQELAFGSIISTCNQLDLASGPEEVRIELSHPALWMQTLHVGGGSKL